MYILSLFALLLGINYASHYFLTASTGTWQATRQECMDNGGDLAMFDSLEELQEIYALCQPVAGGAIPFCWLGFNDLETLNEWKWIDGTPFDGTDYLSQSGLETGDTDRCGAVVVSGSTPATSIEDYICSVPIYGICQPVMMSTTMISTTMSEFSGNDSPESESDESSDDSSSEDSALVMNREQNEMEYVGAESVKEVTYTLRLANNTWLNVFIIFGLCMLANFCLYAVCFMKTKANN